LIQQQEHAAKEKDELIQQQEHAAKEKDELIQQQEHAAKEKDELIQQQEHAAKEKDELIQQQEHAAKEKDKLIQKYDLLIQEQKLARDALEEKEYMIQKLNRLMMEQKKDLIGKEFLLEKLTERSKINQRRKISIPPYLKQKMKRMKQLVSPRLGDLVQYAHTPKNITKMKRVSLLDESTPLVISIVTPSFSQGGFIERTLLSVLEQNYPNLEYFVQDGGSTDNTQAILKEYNEKLSGWKSENDSGQSQAINRGFDRTSGEIMAWLNSDDLLLPNTLAIISNYFQTHPDIDVVYGNRLLIDENDMEIGRWLLPGHSDTALSWADYIPQETLFWRRSIWEKAGGEIDESFRFAMDWDLLTRFRNSGAKFSHIPIFLGAFRIHQAQKTSAAISDIGYQEMDKIRERELGKLPAANEINKAVLPFLLRHIAIDIVFRLKKAVGLNVY